MNNFDDSIEELFQELEQDYAAQALHNDRKFLSSLSFTTSQLQRYDNTVRGINTRLQVVLARKRT